MSTEMKYVVFDGRKGEQIIIFPKIIQHSSMAAAVTANSFGGMHPISGGFIYNGQCVGESLSLRMKSRGDLDTRLIPNLLDMSQDTFNEDRFPEPILVNPVPEIKVPVNKNKRKRLRKKARK